MRLRQILLAAAVMAGAVAPARAEVSVYYHAGAWDVFNGQGDNGQPLCGIGSHSPGEGRAFSLRFQIGGNDVTFIAAKPGWNIPDGTQIPVVIQVGLDRPWSQQAVGSGDRVQWTLDQGSVQSFDAEFRNASSMTVTFPAGSEQPWVVSLAGSTAASNAMGRCVTDMAQRAAAMPPTASAGSADQTATQPFSAAPPAQANAAPTQPVTQEPSNPPPVGAPR